MVYLYKFMKYNVSIFEQFMQKKGEAMNKRASGVRMHVSSLPGVPNGNWAFRVTQEQLDGIDKKWLKELNDVYYRSK